MTGGYDLKPYTSKAKKAIDLAARISKKMNYSYVGTEHILAGLIKEGTGVAAAILTACHDLILCQTVALCIRITLTDSAVIAVILTIIGIFDQPSGKYLLPVINLPDSDCFLFQSPDCLRIFCAFYQFDKF